MFAKSYLGYRFIIERSWNFGGNELRLLNDMEI
jgi:hypothetical protein